MTVEENIPCILTLAIDVMNLGVATSIGEGRHNEMI
jgi:hypothetical protein